MGEPDERINDAPKERCEGGEDREESYLFDVMPQRRPVELPDNVSQI